jgi:hypothetical protein
MLTDEQPKELESWGAATVRAHLAAYPKTGTGASILGFKTGEMTRSDITDWLAEQAKVERRQQTTILVSAIVAAVASVLAVGIGIVALALQK